MICKCHSYIAQLNDWLINFTAFLFSHERFGGGYTRLHFKLIRKLTTVVTNEQNILQRPTKSTVIGEVTI